MDDTFSRTIMSEFFKITKIIAIVIIIIALGISLFFFFLDNVIRGDRHAIIKLTEEVSIKAELKLKDFPGQALTLYLYTQDGKPIDSHNIDDAVDQFPIDYVESRNKSWRIVTYESSNDEGMVFNAVWGKVVLKSNGEILVYWTDG